MRTISEYHRPATLGEAFELLARVGVRSTLVAGGTVVNAAGDGAGAATEVEIIDLQAVCPGTIEEVAGRVVIGAMARLQDLVDSPMVPPLLRELAHREGPNTLRNAATIGGTVANGDPESELLAGLLIHEATVDIERSAGASTVGLSELLADPNVLAGGIISSISVATGGATASARTGRTPADVPIVAVMGRQTPGGVLLAVTGVASTPILATTGTIDALQPPADFRGSTEYRRYLAGTLANRVIGELGGDA